MPPTSSDGSVPTGPSSTRRTILRTAGATLGVGLTAGEVAATPSAPPSSVVVSPAHGEVVEAALERVPADARASLTVETMETTTGFRRFTEGAADVLVGSRPILAAERSTALDNGVEYEVSEVPTATTTLYAPTTAWTSCLRPAKIAEIWGSDGPIETWAEITPVDRGSHRLVDSPGQVGSDSGPALHDEAAALVRGVRSFQYATGFGGLAYYEPAESWFRDEAATAEPTGLVRLSYLYGEETALDRQPVAAFLDAYARRNVEAVGEVSYFPEPLGQ